MLRLDRICLQRGGRRVLADVSLHLAAGEVAVLMGRSGIGKTSLLQAAAGLLPLAAGVVSLGGRLGVVFQEPRLLPWQNALDNAALGLKALGHGRAARRCQAAALLQELGLDGAHLLKRPAALSGGMQQRVAIARALAMQPAVLLLDEPFSALDPGLRRELQLLLRDAIARRRLSTLLVTHDVVEAVRLGGRLVLLAGDPAGIVLQQALPSVDAGSDAAVFEACGRLLRSSGIAAALGLQAPAGRPMLEPSHAGG